MRILITGARGFIGKYLARYLSSQGHTVVGIGHGDWPDNERANWYTGNWLNGDITSANLDVLANEGGVPEAIFHLAGGSSVGPSFETPVEDFQRSVVATVELMEWVRLRAPSTRVVTASSAAVYGASHSETITESVSCVPFSPYGFHKRMAEMVLESYAHNFGIQTAVVRLFSVYGPELKKQLLWDLCNRLASGVSELTLGGDGTEIRDWLYVEDAARILLLALNNASEECFVVNGGTGCATTVREITEELCECWGAQIPVGFTGVSRSGDPHFLVANIEHLSTLDGEPPRLWRDGLAEYVSWYKSQAGIS